MSAELAAVEPDNALSPIADAPIPAVEEEAAPQPEAAAEDPAPTEPGKPVEKEEDDNAFKRRIDRLTARNAEALQDALKARQEAKELRERLAALSGEEAKDEAAIDFVEVAKAQIRAEDAQKAFNQECNMTHAKGVAEFPDFERSISNLNTLGVMNQALINAALEAGDAHKVLYALGKNPEEAERISGLPPERLGAAVAKFALKSASTPAVKPMSKAPEPIKPIEAGASHAETDPNKMSMEEFEKKFPLPSRH
jgi:hypothetical protein